MEEVYVPCLILLKSPHPAGQAIFLMLEDSFPQSEVDKERAVPGSSIMNYTYNEKVILRDRYFKSPILGSSFHGETDNNDAFQFVRFLTKAEADALIGEGIEGAYEDMLEPGDYEGFMHELFPECLAK